MAQLPACMYSIWHECSHLESPRLWLLLAGFSGSFLANYSWTGVCSFSAGPPSGMRLTHRSLRKPSPYQLALTPLSWPPLFHPIGPSSWPKLQSSTWPCCCPGPQSTLPPVRLSIYWVLCNARSFCLSSASVTVLRLTKVSLSGTQLLRRKGMKKVTIFKYLQDNPQQICSLPRGCWAFPTYRSDSLPTLHFLKFLSSTPNASTSFPLKIFLLMGQTLESWGDTRGHFL